MEELEMLRTRMLRQMQSENKVSIDFGKTVQSHSEGEIWEEDGKEWIFNEGIIKKLSQIAEVAKMVIIPNFCPKCGKKISHVGDVEMYKVHNNCLKCVIEFETRLKIEGKWEEYVKNSVNNNLDWKIEKLQEEMKDYLEFSKDKELMDTSFNTELISNDIDVELINQNVKQKLEYLKNSKIS